MAKMKQFMKRQILEGKWVEVETTNGSEICPCCHKCGLFYIPGVMLADGGGIGIPMYWNGSLVTETTGNGDVFKALVHYYEIYIPGRDIISFEIKTGFGAMLSAPGYLDSTNWNVFDTVEEALKYLEEL